MNKTLLFISTIISLVLANPLYADPAKSINCKNASSPQEQNICIQQQLTKLTSKLNDTYAKSLAAADKLDKAPNGNIRKTLEFSQQNWQNYLKASCDNVAAIYQGNTD